MRLLDITRYFLRSVFRAREMDADLDAELRDHLAREKEARMRSGAGESDAHRAAAVTLGGVTRYAEAARDARGWRWLRDAGTDLRHGFRLLRRYPGFSLATILITALGIGATTVVFSAVNGVLIRPLPFAKPGQIAMLTFTGPDGRYSGSGFDGYAQLGEQRQVVSAIGAYGIGSVVMMANGEPGHLRTEYLTPSALRLLGVNPVLGRRFTADDADQDVPVVLLSHAIWQLRFGSDSGIVGRSVTLDGAPWTVIGVMPADFQGPRLLGAQVWLPARVAGQGLIVGGQRKRGGNIIIRLADGVSAAAAANVLSVRVHPRILDPITSDSVTGRVHVQSLLDVVLLDRREPLLILLGAVGFVLLLVAANVATLGLARAAVREREMAVRRALGASRSRHVRQVLTETLLLMAIGGVLGVLFARAGLAMFVNAGVSVLPRVRDIRIDWHVLALSAGLTVLVAMIAGAAPAFAASGATLGDTVKGAGGGTNVRRGRLRAALVAVEIAVSVVLLIGAGLLITGFARVSPSAPGFATDHRVVIPLQVGDVGPQSVEAVAAQRSFVTTVLDRMRRVQGVRDVAVTSIVPLTGTSAMYPVEPEGGVASRKFGHQRAVSPNYLSLMQIPVVAGRGLTDRDGEGGERVAVVNEAAAARWWPGQSPLGRRLSFGRAGADRSVVTVVGVARNARFDGGDTTHVMEFYVPFAQMPSRFFNFVVVTAGEPHVLIPELKRAIWAVNPQLPIDNVSTMSEIVGDSVKEPRLYLAMMAVFAAIALVLAAAGIFSVVAYAVSQRTREIGIRLALGAPRVRVGGLVLRQGATIAGVGLLIGVVAARLLTRFMQSLLGMVSPTDTGVFVATVAALCVVILAACALPMRRALAVDPVTSLRVE